jgi:hypothetical protein
VLFEIRNQALKDRHPRPGTKQNPTLVINLTSVDSLRARGEQPRILSGPLVCGPLTYSGLVNLQGQKSQILGKNEEAALTAGSSVNVNRQSGSDYGLRLVVNGLASEFFPVRIGSVNSNGARFAIFRDRNRS